MASFPVPSTSAFKLDGFLPSTFVPKPFPPPSLHGVPQEYIIDSLRRLAGRYYNDAESSDCIIIFPLDPRRAHDVAHDPHITTLPPRTEKIPGGHDPSGTGRRTTPAHPVAPPRLMMRLHTEYLSATSRLFRALFGGVHPLELVHMFPRPSFLANAQPDSPLATAYIPRLLPSSGSKPVMWLPLPDPSSFHYIVSWMYFGVTDDMTRALLSGRIDWRGLAHNVEYLGMDDELRYFLSRHVERWYLGRMPLPVQDCDDEVEVASIVLADDGADADVENDDDEDMDDEDVMYVRRGRTRTRQLLKSTVDDCPA